MIASVASVDDVDIAFGPIETLLEALEPIVDRAVRLDDVLGDRLVVLAELATMLLEADSNITWLVSLRYNCAQAILWRRSVIFTAPVSLDQFKDQRRVNPEGKEFYNREELLEWIADREWSWLHPRYRWAIE